MTAFPNEALERPSLAREAGGILYSVPTIVGHRAEKEDEMPMYKAVRASRLYEQIVEQIEQSIREGRLKPGEQLNEGAKVSYEEQENRGKTSAENLRVG